MGCGVDGISGKPPNDGGTPDTALRSLRHFRLQCRTQYSINALTVTTSIGQSVWGRHCDQAYAPKVRRCSVGRAAWGKVRNTLGSSYPVTVSDLWRGINVSRYPAIFVSLLALHLFSSPLLIIYSPSDFVNHSHILLFVHPNIMLNAPISPSALDLAFADEDWPSNRTFPYRPASVGNSWGVTSIGRGFDWKPREKEAIAEATDEGYDTSQLFFATPSPDLSNSDSDRFFFYDPSVIERSANPPSPRMSHPSSPAISRRSSVASKNHAANLSTDPLSYPPVFDSPISSRPLTPISGRTSPDISSITLSRRNSRASSSCSRPRRRSSQQRVSLIAGRVSIAQIEPPSPPPTSTRLVRSNSATSFLSVASVGAPTPNSEPNPFLTERSISELVVEREIGRGAYGLVKRAREMQLDGTCGVSLVLDFLVSKIDPCDPSLP